MGLPYEPLNWNFVPAVTADISIEPSGGDYIVETTGYVPKEDQLAALQSAGESLDSYYRSKYPGWKPYSTDPDNPEYDPTGQIGYDAFDAHEDLALVLNRLTEQERLANADPLDIIPARKGSYPKADANPVSDPPISGTNPPPPTTS